MKKRITLAAAAVLVTVLAAVPFLHAQPMGHRHGGGEFGFLFGRLAHAKEMLDLSDEQVTKLTAIAQDLKTQNAPYREQLRGGFQAISTTLLNNPNDVAAAQALLDKQSQAERAMKSNVLNAASKALNVLTPDQRTKVAQFLADRQARHGKR